MFLSYLTPLAFCSQARLLESCSRNDGGSVGDNGQYNISGCTFQYLSAPRSSEYNPPYGIGDGGAVWVQLNCYNPDYWIKETTFLTCHAFRGGGVFFNSRGIEMSHCSSTNCSSIQSGAFLWVQSENVHVGMRTATPFIYPSSTPNPYVTTSPCPTPSATSLPHIILNVASAIESNSQFGSIWCNADDTIPFEITEFNTSLNVASSGSAFYIANHSTLFLEFCHCESNLQGSVCALLKNPNVDTISHLNFMNNTCCGFIAEDGSLIYVEGNYIINDAIFEKNLVRFVVGFLTNGNPSLTFTNCAFDENITATGGFSPVISEMVTITIAPRLVVSCFPIRTRSQSQSRSRTPTPSPSRTLTSSPSPTRSQSPSRTQTIAQSQTPSQSFPVSSTPSTSFTESLQYFSRRTLIVMATVFLILLVDEH